MTGFGVDRLWRESYLATNERDKAHTKNSVENAIEGRHHQNADDQKPEGLTTSQFCVGQSADVEVQCDDQQDDRRVCEVANKGGDACRSAAPTALRGATVVSDPRFLPEADRRLATVRADVHRTPLALGED